MNIFSVSGTVRQVKALRKVGETPCLGFLLLERAWDPIAGDTKQWWNVSVFGSKAERLAAFLSPSKAVAVYGRIHQRVNERTQKLYHNVHAIEVEFISNREAQEMAKEKEPEEI